MQESYPPGIFDKHALDAIVPVEDQDAFDMLYDGKEIKREEFLSRPLNVSLNPVIIDLE